MDATLQKFQANFQLGDREECLKLAEHLKGMAATMQPPCQTDQRQKITANTEELSATSSNSLRITVHIEDRKNSGVALPLVVNPSWKIKELKEHVAKEWNIPVNVQRWLIQCTQPLDKDTLKEYGIGTKLGGNSPQPPIFLYVLSLRAAARFEREEQRKQIINIEKNARDAALRNPRLLNESRGAEEETENLTQTQWKKKVEPQEDGWKCTKCTFVNKPARPGCLQCTAERPKDYQIPAGYQFTLDERKLLEASERENLLLNKALEKEKDDARKQASLNYEQLRVAYMKQVNVAQEEIECAICFDTFPPGEAVILRECLHKFCKGCLAAQVEHTEEAVVTCPYNDEYSCEAIITEHEIKALVSPEIFEKYLRRGLQQAELQEKNSYHCKTPNCAGWCVFEDEVNNYDCLMCNKRNCLPCKAIHEGQNCKEYQDDIKRKAMNDEAARQTQEMLQRMLQNKEAMKCPGCKIVVQKKYGCDWMRCSMCKTEICWATMGARWGPNGPGDTSGGCRCRVNGRPCHPKCGNCH